VRQIFQLDDDGDITSFTFNNEDRSSTHFPSDRVPELYMHLHTLLSVIQAPELQLWMQLEPGTTIFLHNTRVLHGRSAFQARGGRKLVGCYVSNEEFRSRLRSLSMRLHGDVYVHGS
jgi:alpha-ketoglutarate-dependent taurine dioxygenase